MFEWLRKLAAGDQAAVPGDAEVHRDMLGRVVQVNMTRSPPTPDASDQILADQSSANPATLQRLTKASAWLIEQNIALAREYGIGLEQNFLFDQDSRELTLTFDDKRQIVLEGQIIGTISARDQSFLWAWANPSVLPEDCSALEKLREEGLSLGLDALTTASLNMPLDSLRPWLALAAQMAGAEGLYRCRLAGGTSVFVAYKPGRFQLKESQAVSADTFFGQRASAEMLWDAHALILAYDAEMLPIETEYAALGKNPSRDDTRPLLQRKREIYRRYWSRDDDEWLPDFLGGPPVHDPDEKRIRFTVPDLDGGIIDVSIASIWGNSIYRINLVQDQMKITDGLPKWGKGFVWPETVPDTSG